MNTFTDTASTTPPDRRVDRLLAHYSESHRDPRNGAIHCVAIPLIMLSLLGLLTAVDPWVADGFAAASLVYDARLSWVFFFWIMLAVTAAPLGLMALMGYRVLPVSVAILSPPGSPSSSDTSSRAGDPPFSRTRYRWIGPLFMLVKLFRRFGLKW